MIERLPGLVDDLEPPLGARARRRQQLLERLWADLASAARCRQQPARPHAAQRQRVSRTTHKLLSSFGYCFSLFYSRLLWRWCMPATRIVHQFRRLYLAGNPETHSKMQPPGSSAKYIKRIHPLAD